MISAEVLIKAQFYDLDPMHIVWHGNYVRFLEQARCALLDKIDYNYSEMLRSGYAWPVVDLRIKYVRPVRFGQEVTARATLAEYESRIKIDYRIADLATGDVLTKAQTIQVAVDVASNEMCFESPAALTDRVRRLL
ncbi:MAG TPA: acyl-CoA thioesterase [Stellaceae bacterium]|nr:acyl-CoA thioesterase [Stellaceae bacterium]